MTSDIEAVLLVWSMRKLICTPTVPFISLPFTPFSEWLGKSRCSGTTGSLKLCPCA